MSSKTLLRQGSNTKPSTDKVTARVRTDNNELSNTNWYQQQGTVSYIRNKDGNLASESLATSHFSPQEKLNVKYVLPEKFSHLYKELA